MSVEIGQRVIVPLGKRKIYTGIVYRIKESDDGEFLKKPIIEVLDNEPVVNNYQLRFIEWLSSYYLCELGDAYNACLPSGLKLTSESVICLNPDEDPEQHILSEKEEMLVTWLKEKELTFQDTTDITGLKYPQKVIKSLTDKRLITLYEKVKDRYVSKKEKRLRMSDWALEGLDELATELEGKYRQYEVLMAYLKEVPLIDNPAANKEGIAKKTLLSQDISSSSVNTLIKKGVLETFDKIIDRFSYNEEPIEELSPLTEHQQTALMEIKQHFEDQKITVLKGVTGSGKTEIYMQLIREQLEIEGQVLLLLPEIALTTQIIKRFRKLFGDQFAVYHSRFSDNERVEVYNAVREKKVSFVIGVRSSIFLPFDNLKLVIVDEEHETSYKQYEPAPRYHARDSAIMLGQFHDANVLLGSATPSLETVQNIGEQKYKLVRLTQRYKDQPMPLLQIADTHVARKRREIKGNFTNKLLDDIKDVLDRGKQVILFHNRRGYSPYIQCDSCRDIPQCPNCDVSLTYHIFRNELICHYCGHRYHMDTTCHACGSTELRAVGTGTEKIEEELELLLPDVKIKRMDLDTTRSKYSYQQIIDDFEEGAIQILVGTQMVTKGLDFENVELVGIVDTDRLLHFPDFRSHERAFQLISQVSGRAGRKHERGRVILQTAYPDHPVVMALRNNEEGKFLRGELIERNDFHYPPFYRMITITLRSKDRQNVWQAATEMAGWLTRDLKKDRVLGPVSAPIGRIRNLYLVQIHIKLEKKGVNIAAIKEYLRSTRDTLLALQSFKGVLIHFDVDPV
jgi:primosomal protein N' (replication factor Y)